jgi:hypothetical protein
LIEALIRPYPVTKHESTIRGYALAPGCDSNVEIRIDPGEPERLRDISEKMRVIQISLKTKLLVFASQFSMNS